jgi:hypothetical protein
MALSVTLIVQFANACQQGAMEKMLTKLVWTWRARLAELLISWAFSIAPEDYTLSIVQAAVDQYDAGRTSQERSQQVS